MFSFSKNTNSTRKRRVKSKLRSLKQKALTSIFGVVLAGALPLLTHAQDDDDITVTSDPTTWLIADTANAITIPVGADGVVINNGQGGRITSQTATAIETSANTEINNSGFIFGGFNGVDFVNGLGSGSLTNGRLGVISSDSRAVNIGGSVRLINAGQLLGTGDQRNGTVYSDSVANNFSIVNGGAIDAGDGNQGAGVALEIGERTTATITNSGLIQGRTNQSGVAGNSGLSGDGVRLANFGPPEDRIFDGKITNTATGEIRSESNSGTIAGLRVGDGVGFQGSLFNSGLIEGTRNGVYFGNGDHNGGVLDNDGDIVSGSRALNIDGNGLTINNAGAIRGTGNQRNGTVYADSTSQNFTLNNSGQIDAGIGNDGAAFSVELADSGNNFSINNSGVLSGRGNAGAGLATAGDGIRLERTRVGGGLDGSTTGLFNGTIENSGFISSEGDNGTVAGFRAVNGVSFQGQLNNAGTISGTRNGVYFGNAVAAGGADHTGGTVNNSGTISSDSRAFNVDGTGLTINNTGTIVGTGNQRNGTVYADSTAQNFELNNTGLIDAGEGNEGAGFAVELSESGNEFAINNSGTLLGRGNAAAGLATAGDGIRLERTRVNGEFDGSTTGLFTGTINNDGVISSEGANGTVSGFRAVNGVSFQGQLNNSGTISGIQNGVYFGNPVAAGGADHSGGAVNNSGVISSDSRAVNIDGNGLALNNSGAIVATDRQRNGTVYADGTADNFNILNSGSIDARNGAGSGISIQVGSFDGDVQNGLIVNQGSIHGFGDQAVDAGIRLFTSTGTTVFSGDILNGQNGFISGGENSAAILIQDGVQFDGAILNEGTIDGSINSRDGDILLSESSVLALQVSGLDDFETVVTQSLLNFDGVLDLAFDGFTPEAGQSFDLFDFGSAIGGFDQIRAGGVRFNTDNLLVNGTLTVVPEPSAVVGLSIGCLVLLGRRRRNS